MWHRLRVGEDTAPRNSPYHDAGAYTQSSVRQVDIYGQVVSVPPSVSALAISSNPEPSGESGYPCVVYGAAPVGSYRFLSTI